MQFTSVAFSKVEVRALLDTPVLLLQPWPMELVCAQEYYHVETGLGL